MQHTRFITTMTSVFLLTFGGELCAVAQGEESTASLHRELSQLKRQNTALQKSLKASLEREKNASSALVNVRTRLEALGKGLFNEKDDRLIDAVTEIDSLTVKLQNTENAALELSTSVVDFLQTALASDPDARMRVEESIRNLDSKLGMRQKPRPEVAIGSLQDAEIVSIDTESGMLVFNVGEKAGARIGMTFDIFRGESRIGQAMIIDSRPDVSGAMVQRLVENTKVVHLGDTAALQTAFE